jgi:hypothetical protein
MWGVLYVGAVLRYRREDWSRRRIVFMLGLGVSWGCYSIARLAESGVVPAAVALPALAVGLSALLIGTLYGVARV